MFLCLEDVCALRCHFKSPILTCLLLVTVASVRTVRYLCSTARFPTLSEKMSTNWQKGKKVRLNAMVSGSDFADV